MTLPTVRTSVNVAASGAAVYPTVNRPAGVLDTDLVMVCQAGGEASGVPTPGQDFAVAVPSSVISGSRLWVALRPMGSGTTVPMPTHPNAPASGNNIRAVVTFIPGGLGIGQVGPVTAAPGAVTSYPIGGFSTTGSDRLVFAFAFNKASSSAFPTSVSWGSPFTALTNFIPGSTYNPAIGLATLNKPSAGAVADETVTWDLATANQGGVLFAITPSVFTNAPPTADAGQDVTVASGGVFTLNGGGSSDSDGSVSSYAWTQVSGPTVTLSGSGATRTGTAPTGPATLVFGLVVTDTDGASSSQDQVQVTVGAPNSNVAPVATITNVTPSNATQNDTVPLRGTVTDSDGTATGVWAITAWPATMSGPPVITSPTSLTAASFTAVAPGSYTVRLTATDNLGSTHQVTKVIAVTIASGGAGGGPQTRLAWTGTAWA